MNRTVLSIILIFTLFSTPIFSVSAQEQSKPAKDETKDKAKVSPKAMLQQFIGTFSGTMEVFAPDGKLISKSKTTTTYKLEADGSVSWKTTELAKDKKNTDSGKITIQGDKLALSAKSQPGVKYIGTIVDENRMMWHVKVEGFQYSLLVTKSVVNGKTILSGSGFMIAGENQMIFASTEIKTS